MAMPKNIKYGVNTAGIVHYDDIKQLVYEEGMDAAAEERIVHRVVTRKPLPPEGWVSTEYMRRTIRKIQGRQRKDTD